MHGAPVIPVLRELTVFSYPFTETIGDSPKRMYDEVFVKICIVG